MRCRRELYWKFSYRRGKDVKIKYSLCFYSPQEVYVALMKNPEVKRWLEFLSNHYIPPQAKILLIYPCSAEKPYHKSRSYRQLFKTLEKLGELRKKIHLATISEPFGLIPEEFFGEKTKWHDWQNAWYDCPGLFKWWCNKYNQPYKKEVADACIQILASYVGSFFKKASEYYSKIIAFVRTYSSQLQVKDDHTHARIIKLAARIAGIQVDVLPPKSVIASIVSASGRFAWDMYGVAHPLAQGYLLYRLRKVLSNEN